MAADMAEHLSYGLTALELVSEAEGLKLVGVMSRNRPESYVSLIASMHQSITQVNFSA